MEIPYWMSRTQLLLGDEDLKKLINSNVLVVGLGGVGGMCAEMIARTGVGSMTIVDGDAVEASNRNRQVPALMSTINLQKTAVMQNRLLDINPELRLTVIDQFITGKEIEAIFTENQFDFVVDCIDTLSPKVNLIHYCYLNKIPFVSSMGAGGRVDPSKVAVTDISKTYNCKLAYHVRKRLHHRGVYRGIRAVFSSEHPDYSRVRVVDSGPKKSIIGTISYMPAVFGCVLASEVVNGILKTKK